MVECCPFALWSYLILVWEFAICSCKCAGKDENEQIDYCANDYPVYRVHNISALKIGLLYLLHFIL